MKLRLGLVAMLTVVAAAAACDDGNHRNASHETRWLPYGGSAAYPAAGTPATGGANQGRDGETGGDGGAAGNAPTFFECIQQSKCGSWRAGFVECPINLDSFEPPCQFGGVEATRSRSSCGGTYIELSTGIQDQSFSFDEIGKLTGSSTNGDVGDCDYWGEQCQPLGKAEQLCSGAGGGGGDDGSGAGAGGQGGAVTDGMH